MTTKKSFLPLSFSSALSNLMNSSQKVSMRKFWECITHKSQLVGLGVLQLGRQSLAQYLENFVPVTCCRYFGILSHLYWVNSYLFTLYLFVHLSQVSIGATITSKGSKFMLVHVLKEFCANAYQLKKFVDGFQMSDQWYNFCLDQLIGTHQFCEVQWNHGFESKANFSIG